MAKSPKTKTHCAKAGRRILGMTFDGKPIFEPRSSHSLLLAAAGGGKTTSVAVPWIESMLADHSRAIVIADSKDGDYKNQYFRQDPRTTGKYTAKGNKPKSTELASDDALINSEKIDG